MTTPQPQNEYVVNGKQIFNVYGVGNPSASPPVPPLPLITTNIDATGFDVNGAAETWANTHTTITRTKSVNSLSNPQILAVQKAVLVCNNNTVPTASIGIEADNSGLIGTYYGMNLYNDNDQDFGITSTFPYDGSVVFNQEGVGSSTKQTAIKQGIITLTDSATPNITSVLNSDGLIVANSTTSKSTIVYEGGVQLQSPTSVGDFQSSLFTLTDTSFPNIQFVSESTPVSQLYQATDLSLGTGQSFTINTTFGSGANLAFTSTYDNQPMTISTDQANLVINAGDSSGSGLGNLVLEATDDLFINGANLEQLAAGSGSGVFLRIRLNGTYYKIELRSDV